MTKTNKTEFLKKRVATIGGDGKTEAECPNKTFIQVTSIVIQNLPKCEARNRLLQ